MSKKMKTIGERLQDNEEIIKELLAEGKSEREARKQLVNRALEKYVIKQMLGEGCEESIKKDEKTPSEPPKSD